MAWKARSKASLIEFTRGPVGRSSICWTVWVSAGSSRRISAIGSASPTMGVRKASGSPSACCTSAAVDASTLCRTASSGCTYRRRSSAPSDTSCPSSGASRARRAAGASLFTREAV